MKTQAVHKPVTNIEKTCNNNTQQNLNKQDPVHFAYGTAYDHKYNMRINYSQSDLPDAIDEVNWVLLV